MLRAFAVCVVFLMGCGLAVPGLDGGNEQADSGAPAFDAGVSADAGVSTDAGSTLDAGALDAGAMDAGPTEAMRIAAATQTANTNPACSLTTLPEGFYWEIGDRNGLRASGSVAGSNTPMATQVIAIASASKWLYSTYVLQKVGSVRQSDVPFLNFTSGTVFPVAMGTKELTCAAGETVAECAASAIERPTAVGKFFYSAGHFQKHAATVMGLGAMNGASLTTEIDSQLGLSDLRYLQVNLAGGANTSASGYATFLRRMLSGGFVMSANLGAQKVCASEACVAGAVASPAPPTEGWTYSLGHWVEDDATVGDHAFSSAGALGFYPWIDQTKTWYGIVARRAPSAGGDQGVASLKCGRLIRQAWVTGIATTSPTPTP